MTEVVLRQDFGKAAHCRPLQPGGQLPLEYAAHHGRVALTKLLLQDMLGICGVCLVLFWRLFDLERLRY